MDMIGLIAGQLLATEVAIRNFSSEDERYTTMEELEKSLEYLNKRLSYEIHKC